MTNSLLESLTTQPFAEDIQYYTVPHISIKARQVTKSKQLRFVVNDKHVKVEQLAAKFFKKNGFEVFVGEDAHLFFSVLSYKLKDSFFHDVCKNWVGADAQKLLDELDTCVSECLRTGHVDRELIAQAGHLLDKYYASYKPKQRVHSSIAALVRQFRDEDLLRLLKLYRMAGYTTKGAPDLFIVRAADFAFVEVKSVNYSLRPEQYAFLEALTRTVGQNVCVLRVLPC